MQRISLVLACALFIGANGIPLGAAAATHASAEPVRIEAEAGAHILLRNAADELRSAKGADAPTFIDVGSSASGYAKLCRGEVQGVAASRPMEQKERDVCARANLSVVEVPLAFNAAVVVVNPRNTWAKEISIGQLRRTWSDGARRPRSWNEINAEWPHNALKLYGPTTKVGLSAQYAAALGLPDSEALRRDVTSTEVLSIVADAVARDQNALGVLDWTAYSLNKRRVRAVFIADIGAGATKPAERGEAADSPLAYPMNLYISGSALARPELKEFVVYTLSNAQRLSTSAGLRAFAASEYQQALTRVASGR